MAETYGSVQLPPNSTGDKLLTVGTLPNRPSDVEAEGVAVIDDQGDHFPFERIRVNQPGSYLHCDGVSGAAITPHVADLAIVGDLDARCAVTAADWANGAAQLALSKYKIAALGHSWALALNSDGSLLGVLSADGNTDEYPGSTAILPAASGEVYAIRMTFDADNGAAGHTTTFFYKKTTPQDAYWDCVSDEKWIQLGPAVVTAGVLALYNATGAALALGGYDGAVAGSVLKGRVYASVVKSGIGAAGAIASAVNFADPRWSDGVTSALGDQGHVYTMAGSGAIRAAYAAGIAQGGNVAEVNARTDGKKALEVNDDCTSFEAQHVTLVASTDTTITFAQPVRFVRVKNWNTANRVLVKDSAIATDVDAAASRVGIAPTANVPGKDVFPFKTSSIHLRAAAAVECSIEGYF